MISQANIILKFIFLYKIKNFKLIKNRFLLLYKKKLTLLKYRNNNEK